MVESVNAVTARSGDHTAESDHDQMDTERGVEDDGTDGWSHRCSKNDSDEQSVDGNTPQAEHGENDIGSAGAHHEESHFHPRAGDEELVTQCFPARMATPPVIGVPHNASTQASLSFGPPENESTDTNEPSEPLETESNSTEEPQPPSVRGRNLKRKASKELLGRRSK
ncbi:hypothetical protein CLCR_00206 [Cladophialophora carrionii]|uniref:Uncharacterized protein n=1 Tax=Cladophialophora carrionii TaxID=86049 RepID=A0A1C1D046_9EURO|nr:hypothetical protein CLCR_00206 [Cladophialophora carrionii]